MQYVLNMIPHKMSPDASDHTDHDGEYPEDGVSVPFLLLGHQDEPQVGQDVGVQHLNIVYPSLLLT